MKESDYIANGNEWFLYGDSRQGEAFFWGEPTLNTNDGQYTTFALAPNQSITLEIKNEGTTLHNFSIDAQHVNVTIDPGASHEVTVTFPASGTVEFYCSIHRSLGMAGELEVA